MEDSIIVRGFPAEQRQIFTAAAQRAGLVPTESESAPLALIALDRDFPASALDAEIYRFRDSLSAFLVDPGRPELLLQLSIRGIELTALLPPSQDQLEPLLAEMVRRRREGRIRRRLCHGLLRMEHNYRWRADEILISKVSHHFADQLRIAGYCSSLNEADRVQLALEEALSNSLEHGCLALDSKLKTAGPDGILRYEALREERLRKEPYRARRIMVELTMGDGELRLEIEDEGEGFDLLKLEEKPPVEAEAGKGIQMIKAVFDQVEYSAAGRRISLVRRKRREDDDT